MITAEMPLGDLEDFALRAVAEANRLRARNRKLVEAFAAVEAIVEELGGAGVHPALMRRLRAAIEENDDGNVG